MEKIKIKDFSFTYPNADNKALDCITASIGSGEFITICGKSGCGKTTLLKNLKPVLSPHGSRSGSIYFNGEDIFGLSVKEQSKNIGYVLQRPDNQIVTDKVWHEMAFGLESMGIPGDEMRARIAETASFFGIQTWFHKKTSELSGGQKQLLNLASVMVMQPDVLILDEPTSRLDPIAADEFLKTLAGINAELGTTIILSEHRLEEVFAISDRIIVLDSGKIIADSAPCQIGAQLKSMEHDMFYALPTAVRVYESVSGGGQCPVTVNEGRNWLAETANRRKLTGNFAKKADGQSPKGETAAELKDVWFKYEKDAPYVLKGISLTVRRGELYAIMGGNGAGKTTALSIIGRSLTPQRGKVIIGGGGKYTLGVLAQNPQTLFVKKTVELDLYDMLSDSNLTKEEKQKKIENVISLCELDALRGRHPYDLSGGEQQKAALAKILLLNPDILLLDEPTKGFDASFKESFSQILNAVKKSGAAVVMVSHDIEFCAKYADRCGLMFDGGIVSESEPRAFFAGKSFYTTAANRMSRSVLEDAILAEDIIEACGGKICEPKKRVSTAVYVPDRKENAESDAKPTARNLSAAKIVCAAIFAVLLAITVKFFHNKFDDAIRQCIVQGVELALAALVLISLIPAKRADENASVQQPEGKRRLTKRTVFSTLIVLAAVPLTIYTGVYFLGDRKYYFISMLILLETLLPFFIIYEGKKPQTKELVIVSVLCAIAAAGRVAFSVTPQFKPTAAIVIISAVAFGGETGFLVGAVSAFVSNIFFGQGAWTPWQMFSFGIIGYTAGILFTKGFLRRTRVSLCIFGGAAVLILYGGIMNPASVIMYQAKPTAEMFISAYIMGMPFDLIHAASTIFFLWFASEPLLEKLDRVKTKYGLSDN